MYKFLIACFLFFIVEFDSVNATQLKEDVKKRQFIRIGTASISGVYYIAANSICNFVKKSNKTTKKNIMCAVQSTPGTVYNLNAMKKGDLEIGVTQVDQEYKIYTQGKMDNLRSVFDMYDEIFTIVVKKDSDIKVFNDLQGKRVNVGSPGSGVSVAMTELMKVKNWTKKNFQVATELSNSEQAQALCDNKIDAMIVVMASPNGLLQTASATCGIKLVTIEDETLTKLLYDNPYYNKQKISGSFYGDDNIINTFSVKAMFVARDDVDEDIIYNMVKVLYENFDVFKKSHPALESLRNTDILPDKNSSPIHPGAVKFYKEVGLIK